MVACECSSSGVPSSCADDRRQQCPRPLGGEDPGRVLHVDPVEVRVGGVLPGEVGVEGVVVHRADRVGQRPDHLVDAGLLEPARGLAGGVHVVHRVEDDDAVDPVDDQPVVDQLHGLGVGVLPGDEPEAGADELQLRRRHRRAGQPEPLPRVLAVGADGDAHGGARAVVQRPEADPLQQRRDLERRAPCAGRWRPTGSGCRRGARRRPVRRRPSARPHQLGVQEALEERRCRLPRRRTLGRPAAPGAPAPSSSRPSIRSRSRAARARATASSRSVPCTISLASSES